MAGDSFAGHGDTLDLLGRGCARCLGPVAGVPYETVFPSHYNVRGDAINFDSLKRLDSQKRRVSTSVESPLFQLPAKRLRIFFDARDENWNLSQTFPGSRAALLT